VRARAPTATGARHAQRRNAVARTLTAAGGEGPGRRVSGRRSRPFRSGTSTVTVCSMIIDDTSLRDLIGFTDEDGVLSFYAGHTPAQAADPQPTSPIEIRNQVKALRARLADGDRDRARAVDKRLDALDGQIDRLVDPRSPGRGRVLFVGVRSGETMDLHLQIPFRERVVHHDSAYIRPLVAALDEGRPAGILVVSRGGARVLRWAVGEAEEVRSVSFEVPDEVLSEEKAGPSPANAQDPSHGHLDRDRFEGRVEVNLHRSVREVLEDTVTRAKQEGWDRLVLSAPPKLRDVVRDLVPDGDLRLLVADQAWEDASAASIADGSWDLLRSVHRDRERDLAQDAIDRSMAGGPGALGLRHVCDALNEGRVAHLLYDDELQIEGYVSEEGTVHPRVEGVVAASDLELQREPLLIERLVEKAISTSAAVTPLSGDAAGLLGEHEGIAALLRW
jgi:hypothetical protein